MHKQSFKFVLCCCQVSYESLHVQYSVNLYTLARQLGIFLCLYAEYTEQSQQFIRQT